LLNRKVMLYASVLMSFLFLGGLSLTAQETIRYPSNENDETYIDTTAKAPQYKEGLEDWFTDLELFLNREPYIRLISEFGERVKVEFTVRKDGSVDNVKIVTSSNTQLSPIIKLAIVSLKGWQPRIREGKSVDTKMIYTLRLLPIYDYPYIEIGLEMDAAYDKSNLPLKLLLAAVAVLGMILAFRL
jgi:hypothetical protein